MPGSVCVACAKRESFNDGLRVELLDEETFYTLKEAQEVNEQWYCPYNARQPHSRLGNPPRAPGVIMPSGSALIRQSASAAGKSSSPQYSVRANTWGLVSAHATSSWAHSVHGRKIEKAVNYRDAQKAPIAILSEEHRASFLR
ncbi:MAG: integrase core domain-containing protein [Minwuia sp.]|uniref:integrase core domain-containing protein n=1 Tax=Minwuia sp. TaxID=2493630 RepID=UPI003A839D7E